jgi:uncharacterized membrane protein (UPF0127 family)
MKNAFRHLALFALAVIIVFLATMLGLYLGRSKGSINPHEFNTATVIFRGVDVPVEIVSTEEKMTRGLSGRPSLVPGQGMLFAFTGEDTYGIWMKDMNFAIDILWIDAKGAVVDMQPRATPDSYPLIFKPRRPALYVLEVEAGFIDQHGVRIGDVVSFVEN